MYALFTAMRVRRARRAAVAAILPLMDSSRRRLGSISEETWADPYIIGLVAMLITVVARASDSKLDRDALCLVQMLAWQDLTRRESSTIGEDILLLAQSPDPEFAVGCRDGAKLGRLFALTGTEIDSSQDSLIGQPGETGTGTSRGMLAAWSRCFDSHATLQQQQLLNW